MHRVAAIIVMLALCGCRTITTATTAPITAATAKARTNTAKARASGKKAADNLTEIDALAGRVINYLKSQP